LVVEELARQIIYQRIFAAGDRGILQPDSERRFSKMKLAIVLTLGVFICGLYQTEAQQYKRVCYVSNWSQYRPGGGSFKPPNIDAALCSHIIYAFANMQGNRLVPFEWNDDGPGGLYEQLNAHKARNPDLKTLIAVGGWNMGMQAPSRMMSTAANRQEFVTTTIDFCRQRNFDGVDLDFEYPGDPERGSIPEDKQRFTFLVSELKTAFVAEGQSTGRAPLLVTAAVAAGKPKIDGGYEIPRISQDLDFINLMSYDFFGAWDSITGLNAPLYAAPNDANGRETFNLDFAAKYWVQGGCPAQKLILGMGTYGRCFTLTNPSQNKIGDPARGPCVAGQYTREAGFQSYYEICDHLKNPSVTTVFDQVQKAPYSYIGDQWIGYDNVESLNIKVQYMKAGNYGGWMTWNLDLDDFSGAHCGAGPYPLHKALNQALSGSIPTQSPTTATTTTTAYTGPPTSTTTTTQPPGSSFCAGKPDGLHPNPENCASFYNCHAGNGGTTPCGEGTYYNPDNKVCDWPGNLSDERKRECGLAGKRKFTRV